MHRFGAKLRSSFTYCWDSPTIWLVVALKNRVAKLEIREAKRVAALNPM
jgi:hypothetical protein